MAGNAVKVTASVYILHQQQGPPKGILANTLIRYIGFNRNHNFTKLGKYRIIPLAIQVGKHSRWSANTSPGFRYAFFRLVSNDASLGEVGKLAQRF